MAESTNYQKGVEEYFIPNKEMREKIQLILDDQIKNRFGDMDYQPVQGDTVNSQQLSKQVQQMEELNKESMGNFQQLPPEQPKEQDQRDIKLDEIKF